MACACLRPKFLSFDSLFFGLFLVCTLFVLTVRSTTSDDATLSPVRPSIHSCAATNVSIFLCRQMHRRRFEPNCCPTTHCEHKKRMKRETKKCKLICLKFSAVVAVDCRFQFIFFSSFSRVKNERETRRQLETIDFI